MPELKPCPFCGDALELLVIARDWYRVAHPENDLCPLGGHDYTYAQTAQGLKTLQASAAPSASAGLPGLSAPSSSAVAGSTCSRSSDHHSTIAAPAAR